MDICEICLVILIPMIGPDTPLSLMFDIFLINELVLIAEKPRLNMTQ